MVTRFRFPLRTLLPLVMLVLCTGILAPAPVQATRIYKIDGRLEGDPGDGVLSTGDGEIHSSRSSGSHTTQASPFTSAAILADFYFIPVYLPSNLVPSYVGGFRFAQEWSEVTAIFCRVEGRDRHAP